MIKYRQGYFIQDDDPPAISTIVSWIPVKIAKVNSWYTVKGLQGKWRLDKLYNVEIDEKTLKKMQDAYRTQRKVSDI